MCIEELKNRSDLTVEEIELLMKNEKDIKVYKKLSYIRFRALGYSKLESFDLAFIKKTTGYNIEDKWAENGYYGLLNKKHKKGTGRKRKLSDKQLKELGTILDSEKDLTIHKIKDIIKDRWNVSYTYMGVKTLLIDYFKVDINEYLDYNPSIETNSYPVETNFQNMDDANRLELDILFNRLHDEKDVFVYRKLLSFIFQKLNFSLEVISDIIGITKETLLTWNDQWNTGGYNALLRKEGQGRKPKLSSDQWKELREILSKRNDWTLPEIAYIIESKYGVKFSFAHLAKLLKKN